jgi:ABC-type microcin C transport system duplicated ATPase subunit YejF
MIRIENLNVYINQKPLVKSVNFEISRGEVFALAGESGSGKSLTALSIPNLLKFVGNFEITGHIDFLGKNLLSLKETELQKIRGSEIGFIFQDPQTSLNPLHTIYKQIAEVLSLHGMKDKNKIRARVIELLELVELNILKDRLHALPHELSGGQRQRVMIAMAIANNPKLLIADEPTTALDVTIQKEVLELLKRLQKELDMSVLLITHDMGIIRRYADRVAIMRGGNIVETGNVEEVFKSPKSEYTKFLIEAEPQRSKDAQTFEGGVELLRAENLTVKYANKKSFLGFDTGFKSAVNGLNISLKDGQTIGVVGESGSGKSTLAKALLKLVKAEGKVYLNDNEILAENEAAFRDKRRNLQIVFQDPFSSLNPRMIVQEIIMEGLIAHNLVDDKTENKIDELLKKLGFQEGDKNRYPHEFSGGQRQRIGLARSLILEPEIIIFDEPTSALDLVTQRDILQILHKIQQEKGLSYIFISHDLKVIRAISDYIIVMKDGDIVEEGSVDKIFEKAENEYTKKLIGASFL